MSAFRFPHKEARKIARDLAPAGWSARYDGRGHLVFEREGCVPLRCPSTPSDWGEVRRRVLAKARRRDRERGVGADG